MAPPPESSATNRHVSVLRGRDDSTLIRLQGPSEGRVGVSFPSKLVRVFFFFVGFWQCPPVVSTQSGPKDDGRGWIWSDFVHHVHNREALHREKHVMGCHGFWVNDQTPQSWQVVASPSRRGGGVTGPF